MWATSIGSTFSHSPVAGERKSGIPDGTEIPAPVSATADPAPAISAASRPISSPDGDGCRPPAIASAPGEAGRPFAQEGGDPLSGVLAGERRGECLLLGRDPRIEIAGTGDPLDLRGRQRGLACEL